MGKGGGSTVIPVYAGMRMDIEMLLKKFVDMNSPRFTSFRQLFLQEQFAKIFAGRLAPYELVEFSERLLQMAAGYMHAYRQPANPVYNEFLPPMQHNYDNMPRTLLERMFGVYLTYSLFFMQPSNYVVQVRITPPQADEIRNLFSDLVSEQHLDTVACVMKLVAHRAFVVVAFNSSFDPSQHKRYEISQEDDDNPADFVDRPMSDLSSLISDPLFTQLELLSNTAPKCAYTEKVAEIRRVANRAFFEPPAEKQSAANATDEGPSRSCIKERAYNEKIVHNRNRRYADPENVPGSNLPPEADMEGEQGAKKASKGRRKKRGRVGSKSKSPAPSNKEVTALTFDSKPSTFGDLASDLLGEAPTSGPGKKTRGRPKRPSIKDQKFDAQIRAAIAPSKKQLANDRLLEELKNVPAMDED